MSAKPNKNKKSTGKGENKPPQKKGENPKKADVKNQKPPKSKNPNAVNPKNSNAVNPKHPNALNPKNSNAVNQKNVQSPIKERNHLIDPKIAEAIASAPELPIPENVRSKYSKRKIENNARQNELPENIYDAFEQEMQGANLQELFRKPITVGDHFQFKHEKSWNLEANDKEENDLFMLDLKKISEHLSCIEFYKRIELDPSLFPQHQVESIQQTARNNQQRYCSQMSSNSELNDSILSLNGASLLKSSNVNDSNGCVYKSVEENISIPNIKTSSESSNVNSVDDYELDEILNKIKDTSINMNIKKEPSEDILFKFDGVENSIIDVKPIKPPSATNVTSETNFKNEEDLEVWLDDFLDSL